MFRTTVANASQKRTLSAVYGYHQATPQAFTLDPDWANAVDIYPGMVATKLEGEVVTLSNGEATNTSLGLFAAFIAPTLGIDEVTDNGMGLVGVWLGGADSQFEIIAPAWDNELDADFWSESAPAAELVFDAEGTDFLLVPGSGSVNRGRLCPQVTTDYTGGGDLAGHDIDSDADPIARLIAVLDDSTILIGLIDR